MTSHNSRLLYTEDHPDTRELVILALNLAGYEVICTDTATKALELIRNERFDLCLIDNWLPDVSGENLCQQIREFDTKTPILFYSGAGYETDKARAWRSGAQGYLVKPVMTDQLIAEVARIIAESKTVSSVANSPQNRIN